MKYSVFIVEDNLTKREAIEKALPFLESVECDSTTSISAAYRAIDGRAWSLIILDMTFQISLGAGSASTKEALAGIELLQYMTRRQIKAPVIVATQHTSFSSPGLPTINSIETLHEILKDLFPANYRETVHIDLADDGWKTKLQLAVCKVLNENGSKNSGR